MSKNISFIVIYFIIGALAYYGCEKKTDESDTSIDNIKTETVIPDTTSDEIISEIIEPVEEIIITIPDIKGTWSGTFDSRSTVLNITEQTDSSFSGKISISYRQAINQDVKGSFSPSKMIMKMKDQLHSRFQGKYSGKLSEDADNYSGTFIMDLDGSKFSFNLNKK